MALARKRLLASPRVPKRNFNNRPKASVIVPVFQPNGATMQMHNAATDRQAQAASSLVIIGRDWIDPDEGLEYFGQLILRKPRPRIIKRDLPLA